MRLVASLVGGDFLTWAESEPSEVFLQIDEPIQRILEREKKKVKQLTSTNISNLKQKYNIFFF